MPELHILIFQFFISILSASIIPAQGELIMFAFLATGNTRPGCWCRPRARDVYRRIGQLVLGLFNPL
jgi:hypothetical protein